MQSDPLYRQIIDRLNGDLNPEIFEEGVADLLRAIYPGLVPVRGGSDAGMDGAIADGQGEPYALVTTTGKDVIGNLTRNLNRRIEEGDTRRRAVLATSQALTPQRRQNLFKRARELGFTLLQVHDQAAMATLLYRSPEWRRELLNLSGNPPPLSAFPRTDRPLLDAPLVGRTDDLTWLRVTNGDRLLVGQPGSGKTFLLHRLVQDGEVLFVISADRGEIADGLRSQQPQVLIVDDAQNSRDLLRDLRQMREELGIEFSIIASCWPGDRDGVAQILNLPGRQIHSLELLTQDEIVQVIYGAGLGGPPQLVHEIVVQAEGRPGLAVTLAQLCLQGGVHEVAVGNALSRSLMGFFEPIVGRQASLILAALSMSGDAGMTLPAVANALGLPLADVRDAVVQLAAGGVVLELNGQRLSVRPPALRHALIRDVFFSGASSYPIDPVLGQVTNLEEATLEIIGAKARGGAVPPVLITSLIERTVSPRAFGQYAELGSDETRWILQRWPEALVVVMYPALHHIPQEILPRLLAAAVGDNRQLHSSPDHPLRLIDDWVQAVRPGTDGERRRRMLLEALENWFANNGDASVGLQALKSVMSPGFEFHITDPGRGYTVTFTFGYLLPDELTSLQALWPRVLAIIRNCTTPNWRPVRDLVENWAYPGRRGTTIPDDVYNLIRSFAVQMLTDVVEVASSQSGMVHWAMQVASHLNVDISIRRDAEFETLYPQRDFGDDWRIAEAQQREAVEELADRWSTGAMPDVLAQIARFEAEAQAAEISYPRWTPALCRYLAERVSSPAQWAQAMIAGNFGSDLVEPFLRRACVIDERGWQELVSTCLSQPNLKGIAISLVLTTSSIPRDLLEATFANMDGYSQLVSWVCRRDQVPEPLVARLLRHPNREIAVAAAEGEWHAAPEKTVRLSLRDDWHRVVVEFAANEYWLSEVFQSDVQIANDWLRARLRDGSDLDLMGHDRVVHAAVNALNIEARRSLLSEVPDDYKMVEIIGLLVNDHLELYRYLLSIERLQDFHLAPLAGNPEGSWFDKARLALAAGHSSEEVAMAVHGYLTVIAWTGSESSMWQEWVERFELLFSHPDETIRQIGIAGRNRAQSAMERARERERREAVYGRE